jgi:hypothetical protein
MTGNGSRAGAGLPIRHGSLDKQCQLPECFAFLIAHS